MMLLTLSLGILGQILLFYGMRALISLLIAVGKSNVPLRVFNFSADSRKCGSAVYFFGDKFYAYFSSIMLFRCWNWNCKYKH